MINRNELMKKLFPVYTEKRRIKSEFEWNRNVYETNSQMSDEQIRLELTEFYRRETGNDLHLDCPERFSEKIQWRKLYDRHPAYTHLTDKFAVREWIKRKIGEKYLIPLLGVWEHADEIDFGKLPSKFVLKTNHGSGTNIIVSDKTKLNKNVACLQLDCWMSIPFTYIWGFELQYEGIKPKIMAEQFLEPVNGEKDVNDYKFFCFHGVPHFVSVDVDRFHGHKRQVFDMDWKPQNWKLNSFGDCKDIPLKPENFDEMIKVVRKLSAGFSFVRVDLYNIGGKIYFGEMTFTPCSGVEKFYPDEWDYRLGELWNQEVPQVDDELIGL